MSISDRIARARIEFKKFRIIHPRLLRIADELSTLRKVGRESREEWLARGRKGARIPQDFLAIIGPSGSGKSTCIKHYLETVIAAEGQDEEIKPVLHVTLSSKATTKTLGSDILEEYADPDFENGSAPRLLRRAANHMEAAETDVLVLDEIHHLIDNDNTANSQSGGKTAWSVTETIKRMLIRGACPLILIGIDRAKPLLVTNKQLTERALPPLFLTPLDVSMSDEKEMFLDHCAGFDLKLVEHGIFPEMSGLVSGDIPACMYDISQGVIGTVSNVFQAAAEIAMRRGDVRIRREDLSVAVRTWAIPLRYTDYDPFEMGARRLKPRGKT